jgi:cyanobactin maturation PatA/PatG family protease
LNVEGAVTFILQGVIPMSEAVPPPSGPQPPLTPPYEPSQTPGWEPLEGVQAASARAESRDPPSAAGPAQSRTPPAPGPAADPGRITPSACGCGCGNSAPVQLVYALGSLSFDFGAEARRDSIQQNMEAPAQGAPRNPHDPGQLLAHLEKNPWDSEAIIWTLNLDSTPIYAVGPHGPFASEAYKRLGTFLREQLGEGVERVSVPGVIAGKVMLMNGQVVPVIQPELRGMYSWTTGALVRAVAGNPPPENAATKDKEAHSQKTKAVQNFLERVYYEIRNLGIAPEERALNFAATNAFNVEKVYESAMKDEMDLDTIEVERSPICRTESDCWDVKLLFFYPQRQVQTVRKAYRFTVDVSDVVPVMVGPVRSWFVR